jgi:hypothetical protein
MSLSTSASSAVLNSCEYASFLGATRLRLAENGDEASSLPYPPRLRRQSEGIRVAHEGADRSGGCAVAAGARVTVGTELCADLDSAHGGVPWLWSRQCGRGTVLQRVRH